MKYQWETPHDWLRWAYGNGSVDADELFLMISECVDSDQIQDRFQSSMDDDGYFDKYQTCPDCDEEIKLDGIEETSFKDHGRCHSCHRESLMPSLCDYCETPLVQKRDRLICPNCSEIGDDANSYFWGETDPFCLPPMTNGDVDETKFT